jgi:hypothetical protein
MAAVTMYELVCTYTLVECDDLSPWNVLGLVYFSGFLGVERGNYRPTSKSRNFPNGPFTSQVYFGNFPAQPRTYRSAKPYPQVFSHTSLPSCFLSWKGEREATAATAGDGDMRRRRERRRRLGKNK